MDNTVFGVRTEVVNRSKFQFYLIGLIVLLMVFCTVFLTVRKYLSVIVDYEARISATEQMIQKTPSGKPIIIIKDGIEKEAVIKSTSSVRSARFKDYVNTQAIFLTWELVLAIALILVIARLIWLFLRHEDVELDDCCNGGADSDIQERTIKKNDCVQSESVRT